MRRPGEAQWNNFVIFQNYRFAVLFIRTRAAGLALLTLAGLLA
jgi:hypothetical protein